MRNDVLKPPGSFQKGQKVNIFSSKFWVAYYFLISFIFPFQLETILFSSPLPNCILADCFFAGDKFLLGYTSREDEAIAVLKEVWDDIKNDTKFKSCDVSARI